MQEESQIQTQELENPIEEQQALSGEAPFTGMSFNRKFRRMLLKRAGYVKAKRKLGYSDWFANIKNNIQNGIQLHTNNMEENINSMAEQMNKRNESMAGWLLEKGYTEEQASEIIEKNNEIDSARRQKQANKKAKKNQK